MRNLKTIVATIATLLFVSIAFTSCNNDPADAFLFTGKYEGKAGFVKVKGGVDIELNKDVTIRVYKFGDTYTFKFSDSGIPDLTGVKMEKGENTLATLSTDAAGTITITADDLSIAYATSEGAWSAKAKRVN